MHSFLNELKRTFLKVAIKKVTVTDINKGAYVVDNAQKAVLDAAGIEAGRHPNITILPLYVIGSDTVLQASYYGSARQGSGRLPEYRMGRFLNWLRAGDKLVIATDGKKIFIHKLTREDTKPPADLTKYETITEKIYNEIDGESLRRRAEAANPKPKKRGTSTETYDRDPAVRAYVLRRSLFQCEKPSCKYKGFIKTNNSKYIETHHIISLSDDGDDLISNVVALCPNCHREAHYSKTRKNLAELLLREVTRKNKQSLQ